MIKMNNKLSDMILKHYKDAELDFSKDGEKIIITVSFAPEEDEDWKQLFINGFSANPIAEIILSAETGEAIIEKATKIFAENITKLYNEQLEPHRHFYESVEEIKQDFGGIENIEIIVEDDDLFVDIISSQDIQIWRENMSHSRQENY